MRNAFIDMENMGISRNRTGPAVNVNRLNQAGGGNQARRQITPNKGGIVSFIDRPFPGIEADAQPFPVRPLGGPFRRWHLTPWKKTEASALLDDISDWGDSGGGGDWGDSGPSASDIITESTQGFGYDTDTTSYPDEGPGYDPYTGQYFTPQNAGGNTGVVSPSGGGFNGWNILNNLATTAGTIFGSKSGLVIPKPLPGQMTPIPASYKPGTGFLGMTAQSTNTMLLLGAGLVGLLLFAKKK